MSVDDFPHHCRWIHVDGGHLYKHVESDLRLVQYCLGDLGIIAIDHFFEARWHNVTLAALNWMQKAPIKVPFALVERKLYLYLSKSISTYKTAMSQICPNMKQHGCRVWENQVFNSFKIDIVRLKLSRDGVLFIKAEGQL